MAILDKLPSLPTTPPNKKTILIATIAIFVLAPIFALLAGILFPSKPVNQTVSTTQTTEDATNQSQISTIPQETVDEVVPTNMPGQPTNAIPTVGNTRNGTVPINYYTEDPEFNIDTLNPTQKLAPTPTPRPGPFYIANGKQNDLIFRLYQREDWDTLVEVQLINTRTTEVRLLGYAYGASPGDSVAFSRDFSKVIFVGGTKKDYQKISIYSIPQKTISKEIRLAEIKQKLPGVGIDATSTLSRMVLSPDGKKVAVSYGNTYNVARIDPNTYMIAINLDTKKMQLLPVRGLVRNWKDNSTIEYETTGNPIQETKISGL